MTIPDLVGIHEVGLMEEDSGLEGETTDIGKGSDGMTEP